MRKVPLGQDTGTGLSMLSILQNLLLSALSWPLVTSSKWPLSTKMNYEFERHKVKTLVCVRENVYASCCPVPLPITSFASPPPL